MLRQSLSEERDGTKQCLDCHIVKPLADFYPSKNGWRGVAAYCRLCDSARRKKHNDADGGETNRARAKQWRQDNGGRAKARDAKWYSDNKDAANKRGAEYYLANKDKMREAGKVWRVTNAKKITEANRLKRQQDGERIRARRRQHYLDNKAAYIANARNREAGKRLAMPAWADRDKIKAFYDKAARMTIEMGIAYVVDHVIPMRSKWVCGLHVQTNLQVITKEANLRKGNTFEPEAT